ncbi:16808_t:CDS:1, partial [Dentiscutata heterogama]
VFRIVSTEIRLHILATYIEWILTAVESFFEDNISSISFTSSGDRIRERPDLSRSLTSPVSSSLLEVLDTVEDPIPNFIPISHVEKFNFLNWIILSRTST